MGSTIRWDIEHARPRRDGHLVRARGAKFRNSPLRMRLPPWKAGENSGGCFERSQQFLLPIGPWSLQGCCATRSPKSQFRRFLPRPQNTLPRDGAPRSPKSIAPAPEETHWSNAPQRSPPDEAEQKASSDPPNSGKPDSQTNTSSPDTSDETDRECEESPPHQSPTPPA